MSKVEDWALAYLLNSLWQVPLVFCAGWLAARLVRHAGPRWEHRVWVIAVMLMAILPLCRFRLEELWLHAWSLVLWFRHGSQAGGETRILIGPASALPVPWISARVLAGLAAAYAGTLIYFAGRLMRGLTRLREVGKCKCDFPLSDDAARSADGLKRRFGLERGTVGMAVSDQISGPATVGIRQHTLLLPPGFVEQLDAANLEALLAHEFAHMRRSDFAKNLVYGIVSLPVAYHPALWLARARLDETRELVCDEMAAQAIGGRGVYARSLLRVASLLNGRARPAILHAIGILDANTFERRVMHLSRTQLPIARTRRTLILAACALLAVATCASALALRVGVADDQPHAKGKIPIRVKAEDFKIVHKVQPVYPEKAKAAKDTLDGEVALDVVVGVDGSVENIKVAKSLRDDYDQAAIDAVKQWKFEPFLLNGNPIEVLTTITVTYTIEK